MPRLLLGWLMNMLDNHRGVSAGAQNNKEKLFLKSICQ
jgi:hypothetical protein